MAIAVDLSGNAPVSMPVDGVDKSHVRPNRLFGGSPVGTAPLFIGEIITDVSTGLSWRAVGLGTSQWWAFRPVQEM